MASTNLSSDQPVCVCQGPIGRKFHLPLGLHLDSIPAIDMAFSIAACPSLPATHPSGPGPEPSTHQLPCPFVYSDPVFCFCSSILRPLDPWWPTSQERFLLCDRCGSLVLSMQTPLTLLSADLWNLSAAASLALCMHSVTDTCSCKSITLTSKKDKREFILEPNAIDHCPGTQTYSSSNSIF